MSIVLLFGAGSFNSAVSKTEKTIIIDELKVAVEYARLQSLESGITYYLEPLSAKDQNWSVGAKLKFKDEYGDKTVHEWQWKHSNWIISWKGVNGAKQIVFSSDPGSAISNGRFVLSNPYTRQKVQLIMNRMGRLKES